MHFTEIISLESSAKILTSLQETEKEMLIIGNRFPLNCLTTCRFPISQTSLALCIHGLPCSRFLGCHATGGGARRPKQTATKELVLHLQLHVYS